MSYFLKDRPNTVTFLAVDGVGTEITGLTDADITCYLIKNGATPVVQSLTGLVTELDSTNTPGFYSLALPLSVFDEYGEIIIHLSGASFLTVFIDGNVGIRDLLRDIRAFGQIGYKITSPVYDVNDNLTSATLNGYEPEDDPDVDPPRIQSNLAATYDPSGRILSFKVTEV